MIKYPLCLFFILYSLVGEAQLSPFYESYEWEGSPNYSVNESDTAQIVVLKKKIVREFIYNAENNLEEYQLEHRIIWLNSDQEIENNNKIYIPYSEENELVLNKGRVIKADGKVMELDDSKILSAEDEETGQKYTYFTFEGIEKGSFIEYLFVLRKSPSSSRRIDVQNYYPIYNFSFDLYAPNNLYYKFKTYNGLSAIEPDTTSREKWRWFTQADTIPGLVIEDQSSYPAMKQFLIYKLDRNNANGVSDISGYGKSAENAYNFLYANPTKAESKQLNKLIKLIDIDKEADELQQIRAVEDYLKSKVFLIDGYSSELSDLSFILENNIANDIGFIRLYARVFKELGINTQLVMTSDRTELKFDKDFEADVFLNEYLFYFPKIKLYMSPVELESRLGFAPGNLTNNYGLFVKEVKLNDFQTGVGKIKFIEPVDYRKNADIILVDVTFDPEDPTNTEIAVDRSTSGYYAMFLQTILHLLDDKDREEVLDDQIKYLNKDLELHDRVVYNDNAESFGFEPFRVTAKSSTDVFVAKAGEKYLFKVGELIGPQMEMYQEKKRVLPVETEFVRNYHREITFSIPEGYSIVNLDDLNISNETEQNGEVLFTFTSSYKKVGNKVTVTVDEYYTILEIVPELYEDYRKIINSAADFNKVKLIMEKS